MRQRTCDDGKEWQDRANHASPATSDRHRFLLGATCEAHEPSCRIHPTCDHALPADGCQYPRSIRATDRAGASTARVSISRSHDGVTLNFVDDGNGLAGIRDRVEALGGSFAREEGKVGTAINLRLPAERHPRLAR